MIFLCALSALSTELFAYSFTTDFNQGFYWASLPIKMSKFAVDASEGQLLSNLVDQAENEWESVVGTEIWEMNSGYYTGGASGNNIRWSNNFSAETGYDPVGTLAVAIRYQSGTHVVKTEIILNGEMWALRNNFNNMLYTTILHELGHTIGIGHSDQHAVMYPSLNGLTSLTADDEQAVNAVIGETERRQSIGYISPFVADNSSESSKFAACGSIGELTGTGGPKGGFFMTSLLGFFLILLAQMAGKQLGRKEVFSVKRLMKF
jgi:hypothetical protein